MSNIQRVLFLASLYYLSMVAHMKTAFVHDWIAHEGGAEAVLRELIRKDAHDEGVIFTYYSKQTRWRVDDKTYRIITALPYWLNKRFIICNTRRFFLLSRLFDYRNLMFRFPLLTKILRRKISNYSPDTIIISSFAAVKNIISSHNSQSTEHNNSPKVSLYLHSPMQYIRENYTENIAKLRFPIKQLYQLATLYLRPRDKRKRHYDSVYFNSEYTQSLAHKLYKMEGKVKYPPLHKAFDDLGPNTHQISNYYVFMGRVVRYVREIDKIIHLFNALQIPLIVAGDGPDMAYAQSIAGPTIVFTGHIDNVEEKKKLLQQSRGYINLAKESFGIGTAEALCSGVPVFGYNAGATAYLVDESNGTLVDKKDEKNLIQGFSEFSSKSFDRRQIAQDAKKKFFT